MELTLSPLYASITRCLGRDTALLPIDLQWRLLHENLVFRRIPFPTHLYTRVTKRYLFSEIKRRYKERYNLLALSTLGGSWNQFGVLPSWKGKWEKVTDKKRRWRKSVITGTRIPSGIAPLVHMIWMYIKPICMKSTSESQLKISSDRFHHRVYGDRMKCKVLILLCWMCLCRGYLRVSHRYECVTQSKL